MKMMHRKGRVQAGKVKSPTTSTHAVGGGGWQQQPQRSRFVVFLVEKKKASHADGTRAMRR